MLSNEDRFRDSIHPPSASTPPSDAAQPDSGNTTVDGDGLLVRETPRSRPTDHADGTFHDPAVSSSKADAPIRLPIVSRRALGQLATTAALAWVGACASTDESDGIVVASLDELQRDGVVPFDHPDAGPCFVAALEDPTTYGVGPDQTVVAFSSTCPHMGCPMGVAAVDLAAGVLGPCGCHQSVFDLRRDGRMIYGRASTRLARIELAVSGGDVLARTAVRPAFGQVLTSADVLHTSSTEQVDT